MGVAKGTVAYHLNVMRNGGLVKVVKRRTVRGGTEQYYQVAAARIEYAGPGRPPAAPMLGAVAADLDAANEVPVLQHHVLHLTSAQVQQVVAALHKVNVLVHRLGQANADTDEPPRYGVLISCYRLRNPDPE